MRMLITGASGFVGRNLVRFFGRHYSVTFTSFQSAVPADIRSQCEGLKMNVCRPDEVRAVFEYVRPHVVIHAAGNKNVKYCENNPQEAHMVNGEGTRNVARACKHAGAKMIYLSTDLVFDCAGGGYTETSIPLPTLVYGKSKLAGEQLALEESADIAICRSGGIYGPESPLLAWLANELTARREVLCLTNVKNTPTYVLSLAETMQRIIELEMTGTFHAVGSEAVNRFEFFQQFAKTFDLESQLLRPVESYDLMEEMLLRPNAALNSAWSNKILGVKGVSLREGMTQFKSSVVDLIRLASC